MAKDKRIIDIITTIAVIIITPVFFVAISALIPCTIRPFYYNSIGPLHIEEYSGFTRPVIIEAFNDVMNFIWRGAEFKTGQLAWTEAEKGHFQDCIPLFHLQLILSIVSGILLITYIVLVKLKVLKPVHFKGFSPFMYGGAISLVALAFVGIFAAIDFDTLFTIFHTIAFPGKENWVFDWDTEQIIRILPESFFFTCAAFIISMVIIQSITVIVLGIIFRDKKKIPIEEEVEPVKEKDPAE